MGIIFRERDYVYYYELLNILILELGNSLLILQMNVSNILLIFIYIIE